MFYRAGFLLLFGLFLSAATFTVQNPSQLLGRTDGSAVPAGYIGEYHGVSSNAIASGTANFTGSTTAITGGSGISGLIANCYPSSGTITCVQPVYFSTTPATGFAVNTTYWIDPASYSGSTFKLASSIANAIAGTDITPSGSTTATMVVGAFLTTSIANDTLALNLPTGYWNCRASSRAAAAAGTTVTQVQAGLTLISGTLQISPTLGDNAFIEATMTTSAAQGIAIQGGLVNSSGIAPLILESKPIFAVSSMSGGGGIGCWRVA